MFIRIALSGSTSERKSSISIDIGDGEDQQRRDGQRAIERVHVVDDARRAAIHQRREASGRRRAANRRHQRLGARVEHADTC